MFSGAGKGTDTVGPESLVFKSFFKKQFQYTLLKFNPSALKIGLLPPKGSGIVIFQAFLLAVKLLGSI